MNFLSRKPAYQYPSKEESLTALNTIRPTMLGKDYDYVKKCIEDGYGFVKYDEHGPIITIDHTIALQQPDLFDGA